MSHADDTPEGNPTEAELQDELDRLRALNQLRYRRRMAIVAVALLIAAGFHWRRSIALRAMGEWNAYQGGGDRITAAGAIAAVVDEDALYVDVRDAVEFETSHIPGARSLPLEQLKRGGWPSDWPTGRPIVVYCTIGYRSGVAAAMLASKGMRARNVVGGILALADEGESLVDDRGRTFRVHTWSEDYAWLAPPLYEAVWGSKPEK